MKYMKTARLYLMLMVSLSGLLAARDIQARSDFFRPEFYQSEFFTCDHFSNNLWGLHQTLEETYGLSFEIMYNQDFFWNAHGGINTHDSGEYPREIGLYLDLDTEKAGWWKNGTFFLFFERAGGHSPSERHTGDFQYISNIDVKRFTQISELWYRHSFFDNKLWVKLGKMEANNDFSFIEYGLEFINSSAAVPPNIPLPTYPHQDWGAVAGTQPADWFSMNIGIYQGDIRGGRSIGHTLDNLRGLMLMAEPSFHYSLGGLPGSLSFGSWWNGRHFESLHAHSADNDKFGKSYGWYVTWQQLLWHENSEAEGCEQGIGLFAQYSRAPKDRSEAAEYLGGGVRWVGAFPARDEDVMGLGAFAVRFSDRADFDKHAEAAIEFFYKAQIFGWMALKPDIQYIVSPGGTKNDNALAAGGRLELVF